ncbi:MAG: hypothetical protein DI585_02310 [Pseudomonas fluorescens]|nr:MAG: hypothetical protein DI585_02310 [Pseudomonas fluorescens]
MAQAYQPKVWQVKASLGVVILAAVTSGCQSSSAGMAYAAPPYPAYDYSGISPAAGPVAQSPMPSQVVPSYPPAAYQALEAANIELKERLERVEKAMLRLDRRMQLVERNELGRMGGQTSSLGAPTAPQSGYVASTSSGEMSSSDEQVAMKALNIGADASDYRPVASRGEAITSALQAAPSLSSTSFSGEVASSGEGVRVASRNNLPSLADPAPSVGRSLQQGNSDVAIWTVKYEPSKVWPDRAQLPSSRDVVEALRKNGTATIYARGKNANAVEFRERVKALSRYLSKVSSLESVPIAAMAAPHLDDETIEILATH